MMKFIQTMNSVGRASALVFTVLLVPLASTYAQQKTEAYRISTFSVNDGVMLDVRTSGGFIYVMGRDVDEVTVEMYVRKRGRYITEPTDLQDWKIDISKKGNTVTAHAKKESTMRWNRNTLSVAFVVYAPVEAVSKLRTSGGSLRLANLRGDQSAHTSGGSINAEGVLGNMELRTSGGSITVKDVQGEVTLNTSGGRISVDDLLGELKARTSGGSISLNGVEGNVSASTSGGSINAEILSPKDRIELRTSGGSITVTVPQNRGYNLDLNGNRVSADLENFTGEYKRNEIEGRMNGGGTLLKARTSGGSVNLRYLQQ